jgi:hypothetical protein
VHATDESVDGAERFRVFVFPHAQIDGGYVHHESSRSRRRPPLAATYRGAGVDERRSIWSIRDHFAPVTGPTLV